MRLLFALVACVFLSSCAEKPAMRYAATPEVVSVAPVTGVRPLSLASMQYNVPAEEAITYNEVGVFCLPARKPDKEKPISFDDPRIQQLLLGFVADSLEDRGYVVDRSGKARLSLASELTAYVATLCFPYAGFGDTGTGTGEVWVQFRWVLTDSASGTVLVDATTDGNAAVDSSIAGVRGELLRRGLDHAMANLLAQSAFVGQLAGSEARGQDGTASTGAAPTEPSALDAEGLARVQSAFDNWIVDNRDDLARALESYFSELEDTPGTAVDAVTGGDVRDLTDEGYVVLLDYERGGETVSSLFLLSLNNGRVQHLRMLLS